MKWPEARAMLTCGGFIFSFQCPFARGIFLKSIAVYVISSCLIASCCIIPLHAAQAQQQNMLVIEGGTLIDGNGGVPVRDALIVIRGNKIQSVSRKGATSYPASARVLRTDGKFILPGLIDAHVHYSAFMAELFRAHGVTAIFDNGGSPSDLIRRKAIEQGKVPGPRIFFTLEGILSPVRPERVVRPWTVEQARVAVKRVATGGGDMFTLHRGLTQDIWEAAVD